ncbi:SUMF1/EgtB/PvdO family nonheme iron enzyme [Sphaerotilus sp.]|uniref:SUMF1/EgtB/PvdO family nonheme iron enzyme n=1 Tax=Sphaerotilus sp. TaxID=2093942 RepID=UPI002ACF0019|nr:SUMF1/EgtB/PvdO family nonheme iron enzyme [Sphaerotilus sp.]MDZ7858988.1 SUMF1/EgtB/PvdO family nonheme iron enzyme [Sphaerotilus sp.]
MQLLGTLPTQPATAVTVQDGAAAIGEKAIAVGAGSALVMGNNTGIIQLLIQQGTQPGATAQQMRSAYLAHLVGQLNHFALSGETGASQIRLSSVYTALLTERAEDVALAQRQMEKAPPLSAVEVMNRESHLVLLGGPGSGKSTFVNIAALAMADELLGEDGLGLGLAWLTAPIPRARDEQEDKDKESPKPQRWDHGALLPVRVVLRDLAAQLPAPGTPITAQVVWNHIARNLRTNKQDAFEQPLLGELQGAGGLVLFDGLDEVPDADTRRVQIQQAVETFVTAFPRCRVVVTSRTYAYQEQQWRLNGFADVKLGDFTRAQIHGFVQAWFGHMVELARMSEAAAQDGAERLTRETDHNPSIGELAMRPLLLTLMAQIQTERGGSLPENREALYDRAVDMLLNQWENLKVHVRDDGTRVVLPSLAEWLKSSRKDIRAQLNRLAFEAHRDQPKLEGTADIPQGQLTLALLNASNDPNVMVRQLEDYLRDRAGLLSSQGVGRYQFPHRSFQEYLAACHLTDADFPDALAELARADLNRWREVTLLAAAKAATGSKSTVWELSTALCCKGRDDSDADRHGALLAGQVLAENVELRNVPERRESHLALMRDWQLKLLRHPKLLAQERALAGCTLAELDDPRPEVTGVDAMQFCFVPAGAFTMGGESWDDHSLPVHPVDLPSAYFMARYPVTTAQWLAFVNDGNTPDDTDSLGVRSNNPALHVTFHDARRFCAWLTRRWRDRLPAGWEVALPSEAEWEKAARGGDRVPVVPQPVGIDAITRVLGQPSGALQPNGNVQRVHPWGDDFDAERANSIEGAIGQTSAVGAFPTGASPYGCEEMAGNVWEWTRSLWSTDLREPTFKYPYELTAKREHLDAPDDVWRVVRGGSWFDSADSLRCACRFRFLPGGRGSFLGFRVVLRRSPV